MVRVKVRQGCGNRWWDIAIYDGKKLLLCSDSTISWITIKGAIRNAKAMAKRIGIKYDPEIIKQHGC